MGVVVKAVAEQEEELQYILVTTAHLYRTIQRYLVEQVGMMERPAR